MAIRREHFTYELYRYKWMRKNLKFDIYSCIEARCNGEVKRSLQDESDVQVTREHDHQPFVAAYQAKDVVDQLKKRARRENRSARSLVYEASINQNPEVLEILRCRKAIESIALHKRRHLDEEVIKVNQWIPEFIGYQKECNDSPFLQYDSSDDVAPGGPVLPRFVVFASQRGLTQLEASSVISSDGTEKCMKGSSFSQLYVLCIQWYGQSMVPVAYVMMEDKNETTYMRVIAKLLELIPAWNPRIVLMDLELASKNAFQKSFRTPPRVTACYTHLRRNWRKRFDSKCDWTDAVHCKIWNWMISLPFVQEREIPDVFKYIKEQAPPELSDFFEYLVKYYMDYTSTFPPSLWSVHRSTLERLPRSTNSVESYNEKLNRECRNASGELKTPRLSDLMATLRKLEGNRRLKTSDELLPGAAPIIDLRTASSADRFVETAYRILSDSVTGHSILEKMASVFRTNRKY